MATSSSANFISLERYKNHIYKGTKKALQATLDDIKDYLLTTVKEIIYNGDVSNRYSADGDYLRQFTLFQSYAWNVEYWGRENGFITYGLEFDSSFYKIHGIEVLNTVDDFISVLDENVGELFTDDFHPEGWWTNFKAWVETSFDSLFVKHLTAEGIKVKKI